MPTEESRRGSATRTTINEPAGTASAREGLNVASLISLAHVQEAPHAHRMRTVRAATNR